MGGGLGMKEKGKYSQDQIATATESVNNRIAAKADAAKAKGFMSHEDSSKFLDEVISAEMKEESRWARFTDEELEIVSLALLGLNWACIDDSQPHYRMMKGIQAELNSRKEESE